MPLRAALFPLAAGLALGLAARADEPAPPLAPPEAFDADELDHWAFRPVVRPVPPEASDPSWARNPIDRFILEGLDALDFRPAPEATRVELIRRLALDLTGLPPSPEEVAAFLGDRRPDAYERLVDRLLAGPAYGERWAQHWLDLAHYADSNGFELDADRPDAWRYRDWVVASLNADMPFDEFLTWQLAGDELRPGDPMALIATGFGRCGPREVVGGNVDPAERRQSELTEVTGTVGAVFLGLTLGCARCHDHKFDPIPAADYYRLQAFFAASKFAEVPIATEAEEAAYARSKAEAEARLKPLRDGLAALEAPYRARLRAEKEAGLSEAERAVLAVPEAERSPVQKKMAEGANKALNVTWEEVAAAVARDPDVHAERERLKRAVHEVERTLPPPPARAMALAEEPGAEVPESLVLARGDVRHPVARVEPRPPGALLASMPEGSFAAPVPVEGRTGRRLALARWLARPDHPLTARVIVNRLWQGHFGRGLVATPGDFGARGEPPSHPELLDWLASELVAGGWRLKPIHRLIVTSAAYRQSSRVRDPDRARDDPDNLLVWRFPRRRLDAEAIRDAMLAASGELNRKAGGPGVRPPIEPEVEALIFTEAEVVDLWPEAPDPAEHLRRSLYLHRKRNVRYPLFDAFDAPDTQTVCARREVSTHALQPLILLNGPFAIDRAKALAGRVLRESGPGDADRVRRLYAVTLAREPGPGEIDQALRFLDDQAGLLRGRDASTLARPAGCEPPPDRARGAAWVDLALAMLNRGEFLYIP
jgi:hypothetical protein